MDGGMTGRHARSYRMMAETVRICPMGRVPPGPIRYHLLLHCSQDGPRGGGTCPGTRVPTGASSTATSHVASLAAGGSPSCLYCSLQRLQSWLLYWFSNATKWRHGVGTVKSRYVYYSDFMVSATNSNTLLRITVQPRGCKKGIADGCWWHVIEGSRRFVLYRRFY